MSMASGAAVTVLTPSGAAVTVLTPNGRRQTVRVSANTPLLQVLEDVCRKHGFDAADHALRFQRSVLDLALQWRFASLPNNASLEMVPAAVAVSAGRRRSRQTPYGQEEEAVRVALQMEDGSRLHGSFAVGQNLWDVLAHFPQTGLAHFPQTGLSASAAATPVCVYMRDEVSGEEALRAATLKSLGLTGGSSAAIRFSVRKNNKRSLEEEEEDGGDVVETAPTPPIMPVAQEPPIRTRPVAQEPPIRTRPVAQEPPIRTRPVAQEPPIRTRHPDGPAETLPDPSVVAPTATAADDTWRVQQGARPGPLDAVRPEAPPTQAEERPEAPPTQEDGERAAGDSTHQPASSPPPTPVVPFSGGGQRLGGCGAPPSSPSPSSSSSSSSLSSSLHSSLSAPRESVGRTEAAAGQTGEGLVERRALVYQTGEGLVERRALVYQTGEGLVERRALVYHQDSWVRHDDSPAHRDDPPDDFFEVTADDVRQRLAQLKSERRALEEAPLRRTPQREEEARMRERMERHPRAVVRVQFPDRHVLQGVFGPLETVGALRRFVRDHLEDPRPGFCLFTAPPRALVDADASATLYRAGLFPAALVYFGGGGAARDGYLRRAAVEGRVSALQANEAIAAAGCTARCSASSRGGPTSHAAMETGGPLSTQDGVNAPSPSPSPSSSSSSSAALNREPRPSRSHAGNKEPKWLKLPGRK